VSNNNSATKTQEPPEAELILAALRSAVLRCKLDQNELVTIGIALRDGWITPACAIGWLNEIGLVDQVIKS
jgi:hypothetical protein